MDFSPPDMSSSPPQSPLSLPPIVSVTGQVTPPAIPGQTIMSQVSTPATETLQLNITGSNGSSVIQKLRIEPYTEKSFIVRGDTKTYYTPLKLMKGGWIPKPRDGGEPGWCFGNYNRQKVEQYVNEVNNGTAPSPPTYPVQTISWTLFKPDKEMKLKITVPTGVIDYTVSDVEKDGWNVIKATIFCPQQPTSVHQMVIISGEWQILGYLEKHTIQVA